jgi:DNA-binding transcriptional MocR family regulator
MSWDYGRLPARAAKAGLSRSAFQLLIQMCCTYADKETLQFVAGAKKMADDLNMHRRTVQRAVDQLERAGLIRKQSRRHRDGDADANLYTVLLKPDKVAADKPLGDGADTATVAVEQAATVAADTPPYYQKPIDQKPPSARARARDGIAPGAPADDAERRARIEACLRHGCEWQPQWGEPPPELLARAA